MDMNAHAIFIDVADLQMKGFVQSEPASVGGGQIGFVLWRTHRIEDASNLLTAENRKQAPFTFCMDQAKRMSIAF